MDEPFYDAMFANAMGSSNCVVLVCSNSGFIDTWQEKKRNTWIESPMWSCHVYSQPAPWHDAEELAEYRKQTTASRYAPEWEGIWTADTGDASDPADIAASIVLPGRMPAGVRGGQVFVAGLGLGLKHDHSALVVLAIDPWQEHVRLASCES